MSDRDFAMALATLAEAFGEKGLTPVRIEAYHRGLKDVPLPLLRASVDRLIANYGTEPYARRFPLVSHIREAAEACRKELIAAHPFTACESCNETGWIKVLVNSVDRYTRCMCFKAHQEKLARLGVTDKALCLPEARSVVGEEQ